jgi:hypothetical protein
VSARIASTASSSSPISSRLPRSIGAVVGSTARVRLPEAIAARPSRRSADSLRPRLSRRSRAGLDEAVERRPERRVQLAGALDRGVDGLRVDAAGLAVAHQRGEALGGGLGRRGGLARRVRQLPLELRVGGLLVRGVEAGDARLRGVHDGALVEREVDPVIERVVGVDLGEHRLVGCVGEPGEHARDLGHERVHDVERVEVRIEDQVRRVAGLDDQRGGAGGQLAERLGPLGDVLRERPERAADRVAERGPVLLHGQLGAVGGDRSVDLRRGIADRGQPALELGLGAGVAGGRAHRGRPSGGEMGQELTGGIDDADADALLRAEGDLGVLRLYVRARHHREGDDEDKTDERELVGELQAAEQGDRGTEGVAAHCAPGIGQ